MIYTMLIEDLEDASAFNNLAFGSDSVTSADVCCNAGHLGAGRPMSMGALPDTDAKAAGE